MPVEITEATGTLAASKGGVMRVQIIDEGQGASGSYPAATLEAAAQDRIFHKGLHVHFDHPTATESQERPERSVLTLAGSLVSDAEWNPTSKALEADFKPYASVYDSIKERAGDIGLSIRASAEVEDDGTIARIVSAESVDLVTRAGRGGRILDVIESARREIAERNGLEYTPRHAAEPVQEATDNDIRRYLSDAVDAYDTDGQYAYLEDFDDTYVYFRLSRYSEQGRATAEFRQAYTRDGVNVTLTGQPEEVKPETSFTPTRPEPDTSAAPAVETASTATAGGAMEIKEAEYQRLSEAAGRVEVLENEKAEAVKRAEEAEAQLAESERRDQAQAIVSAAFEGITAPKLKGRLVESAARDADFDADAFEAEVKEAAEELAESKSGVQVSGFGATQAADVAESANYDYDAELSSVFKEA